jgi:hypothetical protein
MLEQKIEDLTAAVAELTEIIRGASINTGVGTASQPEEKKTRTRKPRDEPVVEEKKEVVVSEPVVETADPVASSDDEFDFSGDMDAPVVEEEVTIETLRLAIRDAIGKGGKEQEADYRKKVGAVLAGFKVKTLPELAESEYPEVLAKLRAVK